MNRKPGSVQTRTFRAGAVIFREGDAPRDEAFLVHAGRVEVRGVWLQGGERDAGDTPEGAPGSDERRIDTIPRE